MNGCMNCKHWSGYRSQHSGGQCRRHSPMMTLRITTSEVYGNERGRWPETNGEDWCGDFEFASPERIREEGPTV